MKTKEPDSSSKAFNWIKQAIITEYGTGWRKMSMVEQLAAISVFMKNYYSVIVKNGKIYE